MTFCYSLIFIFSVWLIYLSIKKANQNLRRQNAQHTHWNTDEDGSDDHHRRNYDEWEEDFQYYRDDPDESLLNWMIMDDLFFDED